MFGKLLFLALVSLAYCENAPKIHKPPEALIVDLDGLEKFLSHEKMQLNDGLSEVSKKIKGIKPSDNTVLLLEGTIETLNYLKSVADKEIQCTQVTTDAIFKAFKQFDSKKDKEDDQLTKYIKQMITQVLKECRDYFQAKFNSLFMAYSYQKTELDSLSKDWLVKNVFDKNNDKGSYTVPEGRWPTILEYLHRQSIENLSAKCQDYQSNKLGTFAELAPIIKQFDPEQYKESSDLPKVFHDRLDLYQDVRLRNYLCKSFMQLDPKKREKLLGPYLEPRPRSFFRLFT